MKSSIVECKKWALNTFLSTMTTERELLNKMDLDIFSQIPKKYMEWQLNCGWGIFQIRKDFSDVFALTHGYHKLCQTWLQHKNESLNLKPLYNNNWNMQHWKFKKFEIRLKTELFNFFSDICQNLAKIQP